MLPQFPPVAPQPRLPSPAASCRRLSTAAFSASAYISAAASDPPRPILRFPRPPAGCPSPLLLPPCPPTCPNPLLPSLSPCDRLSLPVPRLFLSRRVLMLPQFPPVAPQPRLPSPAASCRRLSTAAFSASAYISAAASDPPRPILRFPRPPAGCPSPLLLPPCPPTCPNPLLPSLSPCDRLSLPVPRLFLSRRVLMLPQFPPVAPQPRLPSPAASCRRLSTAAFFTPAAFSTLFLSVR